MQEVYSSSKHSHSISIVKPPKALPLLAFTLADDTMLVIGLIDFGGEAAIYGIIVLARSIISGML
jgi:hypothetical protein